MQRLSFRIGARTLASVPYRAGRRVVSLAEALDPPGLIEEIAAVPAREGQLWLGLPASLEPRLAERSNGQLLYRLQTYPRFYADMGGSFDAYLGKFSSKTRSTLKRKVRKFAELAGPDHFRVFRSPDELAEFHRQALTVSRMTYQQRLMDAGLPEDAAFISALRDRGARNAARGFLLYAQGGPVSYLYVPIDADCAVYDYLGYLPDWAEHSPGTVLQMLAMEVLFAERLARWFDFTEGDGAHKRMFATGSVDCIDLLVFPPSTRNRLLVSSHRLFNGAVATAKDMSVRLGVGARLGQWLRR